MQRTKNIVTFLLVLPTIIWMLATPNSLFKENVKKKVQTESSKDAKTPQKQVISAQGAFQSSPTPTFDFPSDFSFKTVFSLEYPMIKQSFVNLFTFARSKILTILFTQYISTLAP